MAGKLQGKYWYRFHIRECPVCGSDDSYKERMYCDPPIEFKDRYIYEIAYDWCDI